MARDSAHTKAGGEEDAERDEAADVGIGPFAELLVREADEDRHEGRDQQRGAEVVDASRSASASRWVGSVRQMMNSTTSAQRDVDVEDPVPADVVGDQAADGRTDEEREAEHGAEEALVLAALGGREDVADDGERDREQRAGAEALDAAEQDELPHLLGQAAQQPSRSRKMPTPMQEDRPAAEEVGQLAVDRPADRRGQQVRGERPDVDVVALQIGDDHRQGGAHDGLVEGGQEDAQQDAPRISMRSRWGSGMGAWS